MAPLGWDLSPVTPGAPRHFAWQAWHLVTSTLISCERRAWQAWHQLISTVVLRGRRDTYGTGWRPWTGICRLWRPRRRATLRGRRGIWWHPPWYHVAGVAQTPIYRRFAWQAVALMVLDGTLGLGFVAYDARGAAPLCVAGVALGDVHLDSTWQVCYKLPSTVVLRGRRGTYDTGWRPWAGICRLWRPGRAFAWQAWHLVTSTLISCGRRGINSHLPSFCVAGVALMVLGGALGLGFVAYDARGAAPLCVAGVAFGDIHLDNMWQACYKLPSTVVLRGGHGTYDTGWCPWAGICRLWHPGRAFAWQALGDIHLDITSHRVTMNQAIYDLGRQSFDLMWEEAYTDAWRTDTYVNIRDACMFLNCVVTWHLWKNLHS